MLFLNFGQLERATSFLARRLGQGMTDASIKGFKVPRSLLDDLRTAAVPERLAKQFPDRPIQVDIRYADQFGLRGEWIQRLQDSIIQGTGRTGF